MMKQNTTPGFHSCLLIIKISLNSALKFFHYFPGEDWFSSKLLTPTMDHTDSLVIKREDMDDETELLNAWNGLLHGKEGVG